MDGIPDEPMQPIDLVIHVLHDPNTGVACSTRRNNFCETPREHERPDCSNGEYCEQAARHCPTSSSDALLAELEPDGSETASASALKSTMRRPSGFHCRRLG